MTTSSVDSHQLRRRRLSRNGTLEGYLALLLIVLGFIAPILDPMSLAAGQISLGTPSAWL